MPVFVIVNESSIFHINFACSVSHIAKLWFVVEFHSIYGEIVLVKQQICCEKLFSY